MFISRSYGKQHGRCEARQMNPNMSQQHASPDAGHKNLIVQQPGSNSSVWKLLVLIYQGGVYWWGKKTGNERLPWLIQTVCQNHIALHAGKQGTHSAEIFTLAPLFEKSAIELKLKPKLLRYKNVVNIATFNVRTLNTANQLPKLTASVAEDTIDIICIAYKNIDTNIAN